MATEVRMPQLGVSMETGIVAQWHVHVGDIVHVGDVLASVETEKLTNDIASEADGLVLAIVAAEGEELPIQGLLAVIGQQGEAWEAASQAHTPVPDAAKEEAPASIITPESEGGRIKVSPLARKLAKEYGIDLAMVAPTFGAARVKAQDVRAYAQAEKQPVYGGVSTGETNRHMRVERMTSLRRVIMKNMHASLQQNAQTVMRMAVDMTEAVVLREQFKAVEKKVSFNDIILLCSARALMEMPIINASINGEDIIYHEYANIGVAVSIPGGLIVPVVKNVESMGICEIRDRTAELVEKARGGRLTEEEYHGGTFTMSSLGAFDVDDFTAIINPPESAILAVGTVKKKPVVENDTVVIKPLCSLCLSYDHRLIDGAEAAKFLNLVRNYLQNPLLLL